MKNKDFFKTFKASIDIVFAIIAGILVGASALTGVRLLCELLVHLSY